MTTFQKIVKYLAMAFAIFLVVSIVGGILGAVGVISGISQTDGTNEDVTVYSVSSNITCLDVSIHAADLTVKEAEGFSVESNLKNLSVEEKNGTLLIKEKKRGFSLNDTAAVLTLYIPKGILFEKARVETGAGRLTADVLSANELVLELGAGEVKISELNAKRSAEMEGGAGKITINGGNLNDLEFEMGVGQLNLTSSILGNSKLELGVGEANLTLIGTKEDYRLDLEKGIGSITVDGESITGENAIVGSGANRLDVDGGVGSVHISFRAAEDLI